MAHDPIEILSVTNKAELTGRFKRLFKNKQNVYVSWEKQLDEVRAKFESKTYDVVIMTSSICKGREAEAVELIDDITSKSPRTQFLLIVEDEDIRVAMSALKAGIYQYVKMPISDDELRLLIEAAFEKRPTYGRNLMLRKDGHENSFDELVGQSRAMQQVYQHIRQAAATEVPVLLLGETGTGKDLAAQVIHRLSKRCQGPYIPVNLGALPAELVASELFGHEKGAFTGALKQHKGKFEQANHGTIFLDEIDTADEKVQVSLLRLIEQNKLHRLGGKRAITNRARLIAASNQNLQELVRRGSFRQDLYYRLDVFRILLPPLRERRSDIPLLVNEFLTRYKQALNKNIIEIKPECIEILEAYDWSGNVRELKNIIQRAVLVCEGESILPEHLPARLHKVNRTMPSRPKVTFEIGTPLEKVEREMIIRALAATNDNRKRAAELLGISRRAIYNKLRKHNIQ